MSGSRRVLLDPQRDNVPEQGYTAACDPVGLVEHALTEQPLFVQGEDLCRWAEDFGIGRNWQMTRLGSPAFELREQCADLSPEEARSVIEELANRLGDFRRPLQLNEVIEACWGANTLWTSEPNLDHAFQWLIWLAQAPAEGSKIKLLWAKARSWQVSTSPSLQRVYVAHSGADAWSLLKEWLGVVQPRDAWPTPPETALPGNLLRRLQGDLTRVAVDSDTDFFAALLDRAPDIDLLRIAAQECAHVLIKNPRKATAERVRRLVKYLAFDTAQEINTLVAPLDPGLPEWRFDRLEEWFTQQYVPYLEWASRSKATDDGRRWSVEHAEEFARQYLNYYTDARTGGEGAGHLAWAKVVDWRGNDRVHLLVVLDGLAYPDSVRLLGYINRESRRLFLDEHPLALAPLPTVTDFAKPAVCKGILPAEAGQDTTQAVYTSDDEVSLALLRATSGDTVVWTLQEPDRTYHFRADAGLETVRREVDAQLRSTAKQIALIAERAPDELRLRIVITTDHGRLLRYAERTTSVPPGMVAHGRAAWGRCDVHFDETGWLIDNGIAYLSPTRFGLPPDQGYAVIVSDDAFRTADGRGGSEPFPHGGLFPEEVLIPWLGFTRDREPVKVEVTLTGKGEEGKLGRAILALGNLGPVSITVVGLAFDKIGTPIVLEEQVRAFDKKRLDVPLAAWPSKQDLETLTAYLTYQLPDGRLAKFEFRPELEVESLYDRRDILGELEGL